MPEVSPPQSSAFARQVTAHREKRNWSRAQLGTRMGFDSSYVSHVENETKPPTLKFAEKCDQVFDLPGTFLELVGVVTGEDSAAVADAEADALAIYMWEYRVPGILQVPDYARAYMRSGGWPEEKIEREVQVRLDRQRVLDRLVSGWFVLDESALHRVYGSRDVMTGQLEHLEAVATRPNVGLQQHRGWVLPSGRNRRPRRDRAGHEEPRPGAQHQPCGVDQVRSRPEVERPSAAGLTCWAARRLPGAAPPRSRRRHRLA